MAEHKSLLRRQEEMPRVAKLPPAPVSQQVQNAIDHQDEPEPEPVIELYAADVQALSKALGLNITSADRLVSRVRSMTSLDLDGVEITLEPALLQRLRSRCIRQDFGEFLTFEIRRQLQAFVGM